MDDDVIGSNIRQNAEEKNMPLTDRRMTPARWIFLAIGVGFTLFQVVSTELQVAELRNRGFGDVVIDSTRNHAYFPLIGGIAGALVFIGLGKVLKNLFRSQNE